jgi:hypothetical protein
MHNTNPQSLETLYFLAGCGRSGHHPSLDMSPYLSKDVLVSSMVHGKPVQEDFLVLSESVKYVHTVLESVLYSYIQ